MEVITIATPSHLRHARRLAISLCKWHPDWHLTLYCEDEETSARSLGIGPWTCRRLPSIGELGVKRAKFDAYVEASRRGAFVWLDADVIVLDALDALVPGGSDALVASPDDLAECDFIDDRQRPWPADPALLAKVYFNSGVFAASAAMNGFFERSAAAARDDVQWRAWTIDGRLLDNHFLCAMVNREGIPVRALDGRQYNWQGLRQRGRLMIRAEGDALVNVETGQRLHLAHFAGIADIDDWLHRLPPPELAFLARAVSRGDEDMLAALGATCSSGEDDSAAVKSAFMFARRAWLRDSALSEEREEARTVLSFVRSVPTTSIRWNGLPCGGAYLEPAEYLFLRRVVREAGVQQVVEVGAGYTSALFRREASQVLALESQPGPWIDVAQAAGAVVRVVPFDPSSSRFDEYALTQAVQGMARSATDLLFIDSPIGTLRRRALLAQLEPLLAPRLVAFHDAHRDAELVFAAGDKGWVPFRHLSSWRGLVVLQRGSAAPHAAQETGNSEPRFPDIAVATSPDTKERVHVTLRNQGISTVACSGPRSWRLSWHQEPTAAESAQWDNPRIPLPCDLEPGDEIELPVELPAALQSECWFDLVQEGVCWLSQVRPALRDRRLMLNKVGSEPE